MNGMESNWPILNISFPGLLHILCIFNQEAESEDIGEAESEIPAGAHGRSAAFPASFVNCPHDEEQNSVGYGLVELSGMTGKTVHSLENKSPGHIRHLTDNLRVHQITQADEAGGGSGGNGNIVEHGPDAYLTIPYIEPKGNDQSESSTMTGKTLIAREFPSAIGHKVNRQQHLHDVFAGSKEIVGLIE